MFDCNDSGGFGSLDCASDEHETEEQEPELPEEETEPEEDVSPMGISIVLDTDVLYTGPNGGDNLQLHAVYKESDGNEYEVYAEWYVSDSEVATIDQNGYLTPSVYQGGVVDVFAFYDIYGASATVNVLYEEQIVEEGVYISWFIGQETPVLGTGFTYPEGNTVIPNNTAAITFQWNDNGARRIQVALLHRHFGCHCADGQHKLDGRRRFVVPHRAQQLGNGC